MHFRVEVFKLDQIRQKKEPKQFSPGMQIHKARPGMVVGVNWEKLQPFLDVAGAIKSDAASFNDTLFMRELPWILNAKYRILDIEL